MLIIQGTFARLQDPRPEDFAARGLRSAKPGTSPLGYFPILALASALGVLLVSFSYDMSRYGNMALEFLFLPGLLLIYVPNLVRLISAAPLRFERICLLCQVGMCFFLVQLMVSPLYISSHDAMLHWITADNILRTRHLFGVNLLDFRRTGRTWNPELRKRDPGPEDLYVENYIKEVFLDSDTDVAAISGIPGLTD